MVFAAQHLDELGMRDTLVLEVLQSKSLKDWIMSYCIVYLFTLL